jgi:hypothetical protein
MWNLGGIYAETYYVDGFAESGSINLITESSVPEFKLDIQKV